MHSEPSDAGDAPGPSATPTGPDRRRWSRGRIIATVAAAVVLVLVVVVVMGLRSLNRPVPSFPSLADNPDPAVTGTVAYTDPASGCVRIVAAGGGPSREVFCLPALDPADAKAKGKPIGPQLVWLDGSRLQVTMFRMTDPPGPGFNAGWQKIVDVATGAVTDVPVLDGPTEPDLTTRPTSSPTGEKVAFTSDASSGKITITLTDAAGTARTLLEAQGPGEYVYGLNSVFWAPDFSWIAADDGRILVITPDRTPTVRMLVDITGGPFGADDPRLSGFAVTTENLMTAS